MSDFDLSGGGTLYILTPLSDAAREWVSEHIPEDAMTFGGGIAIEHRYVQDIIDGIMGDGLTIE